MTPTVPGETTAPTETPTAPTEPTDGTTAPTEGTTEPTDGTTDPTEGTTAPTEETVPPTISQIGTIGGTQDSTAAPGGTTAGKPVPQEPGSKLNIWYILAPAGVLAGLMILLLVLKRRKKAE